MTDSEHRIWMSQKDTTRFRKWLERPSGAFTAGLATIEAVEGGTILIRTKPRFIPR